MYDTKLLIAGRLVPARGGASFERRNPVSGAIVTRAAAAQVPDATAAADAAQAAFPAWSSQGPGARRAKLNKAADLLEARAQEIAVAVRDETGSTAGWGHFNVHFAASLLREAAAMTTQIVGEVIPSDVPGKSGDGLAPAGGRRARHCALERADHSRRARDRDAAGLRQHRHPQVLRGLPGDATR